MAIQPHFRCANLKCDCGSSVVSYRSSKLLCNHLIHPRVPDESIFKIPAAPGLCQKNFGARLYHSCYDDLIYKTNFCFNKYEHFTQYNL